MRTRLGWALVALSAVCVALGVAVMVVLGPDSRMTTGPHPVDTDGFVVVTAPKVLTWQGVRIDVLAELPANKPVFVGLGNSVDVQDFVADSERLEVTSFGTPWSPRTREVKGRENLPSSPTALDWWIAKSAGLGGARLSTTLPDETVSLAITSVGSSNLTGLRVSLAYGVEGGFLKGTGLLLLGVGGVWAGLLVRRGPDLRRSEADDVDGEQHVDDEEVVYVYLDDDGVEHEISAAEAAGYDVVETVVVEHPPGPEPDAARVVYVFVDDDGVEHEVGEDELDDYEILDEEDER